MKLLITMKLSDKNLLYHIYPISLVDKVDKIFIVRDKRGPEISKVQYFCPPNYALKIPPLAFFYKFLLMMYLSILEKPFLIHSYLLFPHGYLAFIVGKLTKRNIGVSLIAGPVELYCLGGSPIRKYSYNKPLPNLSLIGKTSLNILKSIEFISVAGSFTKKYLINIGISETNLFEIPYVVLDDKLVPLSKKKTYDIIYVGRLAKVKHIENIFYITKKLIDIYKLVNIQVCVMGSGPCEIHLQKLCHKLNLDKNISFLGYKVDVGSYFNISKLSIITSERETGPLTAIESMMCGVPVVSSECGDTVLDLIVNDYNGVLIKDYDNIDLFAKEIANLLENPQKLHDYSINALNSVINIRADNIAQAWKNSLEYKFKMTT